MTENPLHELLARVTDFLEAAPNMDPIEWHVTRMKLQEEVSWYEDKIAELESNLRLIEALSHPDQT